ncbi:ParB-like nuclease domain-containing protein [Saccharicrinis carchari]|uniref:ParB-like nuclease domain-containing protein n=1 Tax=Saccharicrinis carchari TaxID=1168039 RepID=A0A521DJ44_SACCC|nr:ParB N-terminal domain-containing protein [Saccharicrinis carchari]SMO71763.1 ParB-like nuclease domain-containing protein [Saccharicrinis carchari]
MKNEWINKKRERSVNSLKLWSDNPRLNPSNEYVRLSDYINEIISNDFDKNEFIRLVKSIVDRDFLSFDPVVVWQKEKDGPYTVIEGNRRVIALKLLREPHKAPKAIKQTIAKLAQGAKNKDFLEKIPVLIAPSFEDIEWYLHERHNQSGLMRKWSREQQLNAIYDLYEKYNGDIASLIRISGLSQGDIEGHIRVIKLKNYIHNLKDLLSDEEYSTAVSHRFPISTLERWFSNTEVRKRWNINYDGVNVNVETEEDDFKKAYSQLVKWMLADEKAENKINSRTIRNAEQIVHFLDKFEKVNKSDVPISFTERKNNGTVAKDVVKPQTASPITKNNKRTKLIDNKYSLTTTDLRLLDIFEELKNIPLRWKNAISASIRVILDISVRNYIINNNLEADICKKYKTALVNITLQQRLDFLKDKLPKKQNDILAKLLNYENEFSLSVLNGFVHGSDTHHLDAGFLNRFWDFLFPLFKEILDISEVENK